MLQQDFCDLQLSPSFLVAPQNTHSSQDEGLFVRQGHWFIVPWLLLTNAVGSIRYTGVKSEGSSLTALLWSETSMER